MSTKRDKLQEAINELRSRFITDPLGAEGLTFKPQVKYNRCTRCKKANVERINNTKFICPKCGNKFVVVNWRLLDEDENYGRKK